MACRVLLNNYTNSSLASLAHDGGGGEMMVRDGIVFKRAGDHSFRRDLY